MTRVAKGKNITLHDAQTVGRFGFELKLVARLIREGHTKECARLQVFEDKPGCTCPRPEDADNDPDQMRNDGDPADD